MNSLLIEDFLPLKVQFYRGLNYISIFLLREN